MLVICLGILGDAYGCAGLHVEALVAFRSIRLQFRVPHGNDLAILEIVNTHFELFGIMRHLLRRASKGVFLLAKVII